MFIDRSMTREVITVDPESTILSAQEKMSRHGIDALPVVESDGLLVGLLTEKDLKGALPSGLLPDEETCRQKDTICSFRVKEIMTKDPVTLTPYHTQEDALLLILKTHANALPVVDREKRLMGIITVRDVLRALAEVLGLNEPGCLLCVLTDDRAGEMKRLVDAITAEGIRFGSVLAARHWEKGKKAFFPYLFTNNTVKIKKRLEALGFQLPNPLEWYIGQIKKGAKEICREGSDGK